MKIFKTISELEILRCALMDLTEKWAKENDRAHDGSSIAARRAAKYWAQIQEINPRIIELETK